MKREPRNYALLIGVQDYSSYDISLDQPRGTSDLKGAVNDARAFYRQCILAGFSPDNIRVLTSPKLSPADLGPTATRSNVREATQDEIVEGLHWLVRSIAGHEPASGLLTFSGHGRVDDGGVDLCPSDLTGSLDQVVSVEALVDRLAATRAGARLTLFLDCCHAQAGKNRGDNLVAQTQAKAASFRESVIEKAHEKGRTRAENILRRLQDKAAQRKVSRGGTLERVLSACQPDQVSEWSVFDGEWRGAFSWALSSAMGQWQTSDEDGVIHFDVSHEELLRRARALLSALSFDQVPTLIGPEPAGALPLLYPGREAPANATSREPTQARCGGQIDGGMRDFRVYSLALIRADQSQLPIARMVVTNARGEEGTFYYQSSGGVQSLAMVPDRETWFTNASALAQLASGVAAGGTLHFSRMNTTEGSADWKWSDVSEASPIAMGPCTQLETAAASCTWSRTTEEFPVGSLAFGSSTSSPVFAVALCLASSGTSLDRVVWYQTGTSNVAPNGNDLAISSQGESPQDYHPQGPSGSMYSASSDF